MNNPDLTKELNTTLASLRGIIAGLREDLGKAERVIEEARPWQAHSDRLRRAIQEWDEREKRF